MPTTTPTSAVSEPRRPTISVIVPTLNRHQDMAEFLETLRTQTVLPEELVVVDAGDDPVESVLRAGLEGTPIRLKYRQSRAGTSYQRNVAIELAEGEIFFFFDDDVLLDPDYIERSLECFALEHDPPVGGVMGCYNNFPPQSGSRRSFRRFFRMTHNAEDEDPTIYSSGGVRWIVMPSDVIRVPVASGGRVAYRRECFDDERFDDFLPGYTHNEDVELSWRVGRRWTIVQTPRAQLFHKWSPVSRVSLPDRARRIIYGKYYFFSQHMPKEPRNLAAFAWSNVGLGAYYLGVGLSGKEPGVRQIMGGVAAGYRQCLKDALS